MKKVTKQLDAVAAETMGGVLSRAGLITPLFLAMHCVAMHSVLAAGGSLTVSVRDEADDQPQITRVVIQRAEDLKRRVNVRRTVPAGVGFVLDRSAEISLPDGPYRFRMIRGPEYRIISGNFALQRTSLDEHSVALPRMVNMLQEGWTSGDCCLPASPYSLPLRMASEDLHLAAVLGHVDAKPIAGRSDDEPPENEPSWIDEQVTHDRGLVFYRSGHAAENMPVESKPRQAVEDSGMAILPVQRLIKEGSNEKVRIAIENPFAWSVPVWLASGQIDGFFLLGDWLRLDRRIGNLTDGRGPQGVTTGGHQALGRWAEKIYWNLLEAGFRIPPLAGSGDKGRETPVGYNRLYVAEAGRDYVDEKLNVTPVESQQQWWAAAWRGQSVATNGPLLRPRLGGKIPGHVFQAHAGEVLQLQPELQLAVRDPVEYLEVIHNGKVHYSARLDEYAKARGIIPPIMAKESGWVTMRVVTLYEDHFRAAMSAPWYIEFDGKPRVTEKAIDFFGRWLGDYEERLKRLPPQELQRHVPYVRAARRFWAGKAEQVAPH